MKTTPKKRGRGQPAKEATQQIRAYADDVPKLRKYGGTQADAVRVLLEGRVILNRDDGEIDLRMVKGECHVTQYIDPRPKMDPWFRPGPIEGVIRDDSAVEMTLQRATGQRIKEAKNPPKRLPGKWVIVSDDGKTIVAHRTKKKAVRNLLDGKEKR